MVTWPHRRAYVLGALVACLVLMMAAARWGGNMTALVNPVVLRWVVNQERLQQQLATLRPDPLLDRAAQLKAEDMAERGYFAHLGPDGRTPWYWLDLVGYRYDYAGENLAVDFVSSEEVKEAWMQSTSHRTNMLKRDYTEVGTGVATGTVAGREVQYVVQFYARPR